MNNDVPPAKYPTPKKPNTMTVSKELRVITRDEYILYQLTAGRMCTKEQALNNFNQLSKGYNFMFQTSGDKCYSVDYINQLLGKEDR